jgi:nuclear-control-of-ATPase protein 2
MATFTNETLKRLITSLDTLQNPPADSNRRRSFSTTHFATISDEPSSRSSKLQSILHAFPAKPSRTDLESIVQSLSKENDREDGSAGGGEQDERIAGLARSDSEEDELLLEWTVVARAVLGLYGQTVDELVRRAGVWEDEIGWWKRLETRGRWSWRGIGGYLIQSASYSFFLHGKGRACVSVQERALPQHVRQPLTRLLSSLSLASAATPQRLSSLSLNLVQSRSESRSSSESSSNSFTPTYLLSTLFPLASLPRSASSSSPSPLAASAFSPNKLSTPFLKSIHGPRTLLRLTKLEVKTRIAELEKGRDRLVAALGELVVKAPSFSPKEKGKATSTSGGRLEEDEVDTARLGEELLRIVGLLYATDDRERLSSTSFQSSSSNLLDSPKAYLPLLAPLLSQPHPIPTPPFHLTRPTALTRLWVPALLIPLLVPLLSPYIPVLREAVVNGRETLLGFWNGWVVEPVMGILNTVRHGGGSGESGLSVMSKEGMKSDMDVRPSVIPSPFVLRIHKIGSAD